MPLISVIIPVYNVEKYLKQCLDSVVNQTFRDIEIICVDDGSTDASLNILNEYAQNDSRIVILRQKNKHAGVARNNGLSIAKGKYIHFLDSDDWIDTNAYEELFNLIEEKGADFIKFRAYSYNNQTEAVTTRPYLDIKWVDEKYFDNYLSIENDTRDILYLPDSPWSGFYNTQFLKDNGIYFDDTICANDVGFFYRCILRAKKVYLSPKRYVYYRENNTTSLVAKRAKHFDCQTVLYDVVKKETEGLPQKIKDAAINKIIKSILNWYNTCSKKQDLKYFVKIKIRKYTLDFVKKAQMENLNDENKKLIEALVQKLHKERFDYIKDFIQLIFSIKNIGLHKVVCILGIKIKIRRKK